MNYICEKNFWVCVWSPLSSWKQSQILKKLVSLISAQKWRLAWRTSQWDYRLTTVFTTGQWVLSWRRSATILPTCHMSPLTHIPLGSPHPEFDCPCFNEGTFRRRMLMWIKYSPFQAISLRSSQKCNLLLEHQALPRISTLSCPLPWAF